MNKQIEYLQVGHNEHLCAKCGAIVWHRERHTEWHDSITTLFSRYQSTIEGRKVTE